MEKMEKSSLWSGKKREAALPRDGWNRSHYGLVSAGVKILMVLFVAKAAIDLVCLIYALVCAPGTLTAVDAGTGWRVEYPLGGFYLQVRRETIPFVTPVPDGKVLSLTAIVTWLLAEDLPWLAVILLMNRLLRLIGDGHSPFLPGVDGCIRMAGWIFLGKAVFGTLIRQVSLGLIAFGRFYVSNPLDPGGIFVGILLLFLADIFQKGRALQQESDETL